jgi:hypothetical protein
MLSPRPELDWGVPKSRLYFVVHRNEGNPRLLNVPRLKTFTYRSSSQAWFGLDCVGNRRECSRQRSGCCGPEQAPWYPWVELELRLDPAISVADPAISMASRTSDAEPACIPWIRDLSQSHDARGPRRSLGVSTGPWGHQPGILHPHTPYFVQCAAIHTGLCLTPEKATYFPSPTLRHQLGCVRLR